MIGGVGAVAAFFDRVIGLVALFGIGAGRVVGRGLDDRGQARARFGDMPFLGHIAARVIGPLDLIAFGEGLTLLALLAVFLEGLRPAGSVGARGMPAHAVVAANKCEAGRVGRAMGRKSS